MRAETDIFALALAVRLMVDDKDIEAEIVIELRHESELALAPAAIAVAAEDIDIRRLVGFEKIALELVSVNVGYGVILKSLIIQPLLARVEDELLGVGFHHFLFGVGVYLSGYLRIARYYFIEDKIAHHTKEYTAEQKNRRDDYYGYFNSIHDYHLS